MLWVVAKRLTIILFSRFVLEAWLRCAAKSLARPAGPCGPAMLSARCAGVVAFGQRGGRSLPSSPAAARRNLAALGPPLRCGPTGAARLHRRGCRSALAAHPAVRRPCGQAGRMAWPAMTAST